MLTERTDRRAFLGILIGVIGGVIGLVTALPALLYLLSPALKRRSPYLISLGYTGSFRDVEPRKVEYEFTRRDGWVEVKNKKAALVVKQGSNFNVFSSACTHLGCPLDWNGEQQKFLCPCHGGVFDIEGKVLAGPPPRPLNRLPFQVVNRQLWLEES